MEGHVWIVLGRRLKPCLGSVKRETLKILRVDVWTVYNITILGRSRCKWDNGSHQGHDIPMVSVLRE